MGGDAENSDDRLGDDEIVIRRIPNVALHSRPDGSREVGKGSFSASSPKFDPEEGISVDLYSELTKGGIDVADANQFAPECEVLMQMRVGDLRAQGFDVVRRPLADNPAHCNILKAKKKNKQVFRTASFLRQPKDVVKSGDT